MSKKFSFLGGGILTLFFITQNVIAYDQPNTHPALTKAAGDFYNLNFTKNKISEEDIKLMMKGAYDEDQPPRWLNHSYDPVHNKAWVGYRTSKAWAFSSKEQTGSNRLLAMNPLISENLDDNSPRDFSYERALLDYARGDRKRAFESLGHVFHLLEDANVPEHSRLDIHLWWHGTESPYEKTMAKWNPQNIDVVQKLQRSREKPILFDNLNKYFDEIAGYSNGYFFSQDTINSNKYPKPEIKKVKKISTNGKTIFMGVGEDRNGEEFNLVAINAEKERRNLFEVKDVTLFNDDFGSFILDDYWSRLSKDFVIHGAGVIKMFLEQAEETKKEYERQEALKKEKESKKSFLGNIFGFGSGGNIDGIKLVQAVLRETEDKGNSRFDLFEEPRSNLGDEETPDVGEDVRENVVTSDVPRTSDVEEIDIGEDSRSDLFEDSRSDLGDETEDSRSDLEKETSTTTSTTNPPILYGSGLGNQTAAPTTTTATTTTTTATTTTTTTLPPAETALGKVVINEIAWMGTASSSNDEWLELYNTASVSVNISGWTLKAQDETPNIKLASKSIDPFGFYLFERTPNDVITDIIADQTYSSALENSGEVLELRDKDGNLQDLIGCVKDETGTCKSWFAGDNSSASSRKTMERINPLASGSNAGNWGTNNGITKNGLDAGGHAINGTPRSKNSIFVGQKPSAVDNLSITSSSGSTVNFSWSAPSDKDTLPANLQYDLRYATKSFDLSTDWDLGKKASNSLSVGNFGATATYSLNIDGYGSKYYFALKTKDNDSNYSDISNQVNSTLPDATSSSSWAMSGFDVIHSLRTNFLGPVASTSATKWSVQSLSSPPTNYSQPVVAPNGTVYYGASNGTTVAQLRAIASDSSDKWQYGAISGATLGTPVALSDNSVLFGYTNIGTSFTKLDASGSAKFTSAIGTIKSVTVDKYGVSYFTTSADKLYAIAPNGAQKWQTQKDGIGGLTPIIFEDKVYITARLSGVPTFYAFDAKTGSFLWPKTMSTNSPSCCGVSDVSYDSANDYLYAAADQYILKIDRNGNTLEQFAADRGNGWGYATTMISQDTDNLIFGLDFSISNSASKSAVYAVNKATKNKAWTYNVNAKINSQIAIDSGGNSYFSTQNGWVYSLNQTGGLNWKINLSGTTSAYPVIGQGVLYQVMDGGRIVKIAE